MNLRYGGVWAQATGGPRGGTLVPTGDYVIIFQAGIGRWIIVVASPLTVRGVWSMESWTIGAVKAAFKTGGTRYWTRLYLSPPGWAAEQLGLGIWRDDLAGYAYWRAVTAVRARGYTVG